MSIIRTVEELEGLPRWTVFESAEEVVWVAIGNGWFHSFSGGNYRGTRVPLPATVLSPRTVTKAEREALKRVIYSKIANNGGDDEHYQWAKDGIYEDATVAALAALNIEVTE